ncbi:unnamed protein product [Closterium sp. NIES-65]|nr:unnamed protein product [Closterium sp. NIES-65]
MYALPTSADRAGHLCVPRDSGIEPAALGAGAAAALGASVSPAPGTGAAAALGASESASSGAGESALSGTASAPASHTFTLDSGASRSFFQDCTTLTLLGRPVAVSLADPSEGPVLAHFSTVLPCPAAPSGTLSGLYLPSFSTNLVNGADLQDARVPQFTPATQRVTHCTDARTGRHLATFTHRPGSSLYTQTFASPPVAEPGRVAALGQGPGPTCVPCVEGRQRATPHSSQFPPTEAPLQTLHMDVWGPARVRGQGHERYFLLVVDDYSRYTAVFPLRSKGDVTEHLHSDRGGEFSSGLLRAYCRVRGIRQTFTLPDSPQQNGIAERRIGMVMDVARTSVMHAAAPHFLWPFAVRYAAHQINLHPRVSRPETSPALLWTGKVGDASAFRVWGSRAFVRNLSADKLSPRAAPCVFLGFPPDAPGWQFYHPTSRRVLSSQDVTFDESVPYYRLFPYRTPSLPPPPLFLVPGPPQVDPLPPQGPAPSGVSQVDAVEPPGGAGPGGAESGGAPPGGSPGASSRWEPLSPQELREWFARRWSRAAGAGGSSATGGAEPRGAEPGGAELGGATSWGVEPGGAELGGAEPGGAKSGGVAPGGSPGASSRREPLSPQELREWFAQRWSRAAGAGGAGAAEGVGAQTTTGGLSGGAPVAARGSKALGGAAGAGSPVGGTGALPAVSGVATRPRPYFVPLLQQVLGLPPFTGPPPPLECPQPVPSQLQLQPTSPLPAPSLYTGPTGGLVERREPASRPTSPIRAARASGRGSRSRPPPVPGTHRMSLRPSTAPLRAPLPSPLESSLPALADQESDSLRAASPADTRLLATVVTDPSFESTAAFALVIELADFAAHCRLDYAASLVAESESVCPPSVGGECALGTDVLEDRQEEFQCLAAASPHLVFVLLTPKGDPDALDIPTPRSYAEAIEVYGLRQAPREWHDTLRTTLAALGFAPSTADPSLFLRTDTSLPPFYILVYVDDLIFATTYTAGLAYVKSELQKRHTCIDLGELRSYLGLQITRDRARRTITLTQSHMVHQVLQRFGFTYSLPQATPLPTRHSLSALPSDEFVKSSCPYPELVGCLMYLMTCTRPDLAYPLSILARYVAPGRHRPEHMAAAKRVLRYLCSTSGMGLVLGGRSPVVLTGHADPSWAYDQATQRSTQGFTFSLGSGSVSWRATRSSSVLGSTFEAEIYAGAMAAQELCRLTYLLTDLGELPRSPPVLYLDNKAMLGLCREQRVEHRTKHIALRYFLARELQQRGHLRLAYVASEANTADVFTKALPPCDHQRFCTQLGLVPVLPHLLTP